MIPVELEVEQAIRSSPEKIFLRLTRVPDRVISEIENLNTEPERTACGQERDNHELTFLQMSIFQLRDTHWRIRKAVHSVGYVSIDEWDELSEEAHRCSWKKALSVFSNLL